MMQKFFTYFLAKYDGKSLEIKQKARIILVIDFILIIFCAVDTLFLLILSSIKDPFIYLLMFVTGAVFALSVVFLKSGKFNWSSNINIVISFFAMNAGIWLEFRDQVTELYKAGFFLAFVLVEACLIGYHYFQTLILTVAGIIGIVLVFAFIPPNAETLAQPGLALAAFIPTAILYGFAGIAACVIFNITQKAIRIAEDESSLNKKRFLELENVVLTSKQGFKVGEKLVVTAEEIAGAMSQVSGYLGSVKTEVENLNQNLQASRDSTDRINQTQNSVKDNLTGQNSAILESSSSIEEMVASINNITRVSQEKKKTVTDLADMAKEGKNQVTNAIQSIEEASRSTSAISDLLKVILNVSAKTNLLSMNAAIEAAHAGEFGKGFSVVASEIKKLAEETNQNTKVISGNIKKNANDTKKAVEINKKASEYFHQILNGVPAIVMTLDEIVSGLTELSGGSTEITQSTVHLRDITSGLNDSMVKMEEYILNSGSVFGNVLDVFARIRSEIGRVDEAFRLIVDKLTMLRELGRQNINQIQTIDSEIERLKT
jgi:methyl-accepting chemotaxis protein